MFQAVGDLVTLKWVREHPLVTSTVAAAAAAYSLATFAGGEIASRSPSADAGAAAASAASRKPPARSISWRDECGGKLAQFMDDTPPQEKPSDIVSARTASSVSLADEDGRSEIAGPPSSGAPRRKHRDDNKDANTEDEAEDGDEETKQEIPAAAANVNKSSSGAAGDASKDPLQRSSSPVTRSQSDEFESASASTPGTGSGIALDIEDADADETEDSRSRNESDLSGGSGGEEAPSPQWGWFVSMTPPQQQMYGPQKNARPAKMSNKSVSVNE
ncbi:Hypothetical Protein FCC1311_017732 [Hondaea fermentalgiana]|uniref:Uncharacterized protein n=1 Tax=Hondaea fermentalgiana TaxID=2315210 RepID=A0A2R5GCP9_9STRA|nr:Hypothetical Protein FCC1311_017732 [Hondaea fermentalgiana]|eukprot:GBG25554.1 Hypothetical Protein FCC1311_017732 [Hondaea fermentalgiana]